MSDLISRADAINAVLDLCKKCDSCHCGDCLVYAPNTNIYDVIDLLTYLPDRRWIPVSERLPKPIAPSQRREWFITSNQYGGVTLTCYEFEASPFKEGWQTDMTILAWMPLPEPWRGEENERPNQ